MGHGGDLNHSRRLLGGGSTSSSRFSASLANAAFGPLACRPNLGGHCNEIKGRGTAQMRRRRKTEMAMRYGGNGVDAVDDGFVWADADVEEMLNGADAADDGCEGAGAAGGKCI